VKWPKCQIHCHVLSNVPGRVGVVLIPSMVVVVLLDNAKAYKCQVNNSKLQSQVVVRGVVDLPEKTVKRLVTAAKDLDVENNKRFNAALNNTNINPISTHIVLSRLTVHSVKVDANGSCTFLVTPMFRFRLKDASYTAFPCKAAETWRMSEDGTLKKTKGIKSWLVVVL